MTDDQLGEVISKEQPNSICYAHIPGLVLRSNLIVNESTVLLATPQEQWVGQVAWLHELFAKAGLRGPKQTIICGDPLFSSTLLSWDKGICNNEYELLTIPLMTINLFFRASRPLVHYGCAFATKSPEGEFVTEFVLRNLRTEPVAETPEVQEAGESENYHKIQIELEKFWSALSRACQSEIFFLTAVQLASLADAKYDEVDQVRTRIIEYSVAMESLLLEHEAELSLRFALRCAALLAGTSEKLEPFDMAMGIYKMRSMATHASKKGKNLTSSDAETARQFLYKCLIRYMDLLNGGLTKKSIISLLDQAILSDKYARRLQENTLQLTGVPLIPVD